MKIIAVETIHVADSNLVWLDLHTREGLVDPARPSAIRRRRSRTSTRPAPRICSARTRWRSSATSVRSRPRSAITSWVCQPQRRGARQRGCDLFGKAAGLPLGQLLGGLTRERLRVYNTCARAGYNRMMRADTNSMLLGPEDRPSGGDPLDNLAVQHQRPAGLARSLLVDGITAMRNARVDAYAIASRGRAHRERGPAARRAARGGDPRERSPPTTP